MICCHLKAVIALESEFRSKSLVEFFKFVLAGHFFMISVQKGIDIQSSALLHFDCPFSEDGIADRVLQFGFDFLDLLDLCTHVFSYITISFFLCHLYGSFTVCPILLASKAVLGSLTFVAASRSPARIGLVI